MTRSVPVEDEAAGRKSVLRRLWPISALLVAVLLLAVFGPDNQTVFAMLRSHRESLLVLVADYVVIADLAFMVIYAVAIAFSIPGGAMMTLVGGFLFGPLRTTIYVVFAATIGATALFLIARTAVGDRLRSRAGPWMAKMESGFQDNAMSYLLVLRLVPLFPFFVVNLLMGLTRISAPAFYLVSQVGMLAATFVFVYAGTQLAQVHKLGDVLSPQLIIALSLLGLFPLAARKLMAIWTRRRTSEDG